MGKQTWVVLDQDLTAGNVQFRTQTQVYPTLEFVLLYQNHTREVLNIALNQSIIT